MPPLAAAGYRVVTPFLRGYHPTALPADGWYDKATLASDVAALIDDAIDGTCAPFDAILLDVDNGPDGLVRADNNRLYSRTGLGKARDALKPGGILSIWSAAPDPVFRRRMMEARLDVEERGVRSRPNNKGAHHVIWFGRKRP